MTDRKVRLWRFLLQRLFGAVALFAVPYGVACEEFERMLAAVDKVIRKPNLGRRQKKEPSPPDHARIPAWKHLLRGLWTSGLRIGEAVNLHWSDVTRPHVVFDVKRPFLSMPAESEKGFKDRLMPLAPEFETFLPATPETCRSGFVFDPKGQRSDERLGRQQVEKMVGKIGKEAKIVVDRSTKIDPEGKSRESIKYASSHDLRRSFGDRWAQRVMPQVLMELMRHENIDTTMRYYVGRTAAATRNAPWEAYRQCSGGADREGSAISTV